MAISFSDDDLPNGKLSPHIWALNWTYRQSFKNLKICVPSIHTLGCAPLTFLRTLGLHSLNGQKNDHLRKRWKKPKHQRRSLSFFFQLFLFKPYLFFFDGCACEPFSSVLFAGILQSKPKDEHVFVSNTNSSCVFQKRKWEKSRVRRKWMTWERRAWSLPLVPQKGWKSSQHKKSMCSKC